jgi:hypothetical protein
MEVVVGNVSRFVSIGYEMTCRNVARKLAGLFSGSAATGGTLFVHEKPKIRMSILLDDNIFEMIHRKFLGMLTRESQRVCLDLSVDEPNTAPPRALSLSALLNAQSYVEDPVS